MLLNNSVGHRKAQARATRLALTRDVLGGEGRVVELVDVFRFDSGSAVVDIHLHGVTVHSGDAQSAALGRHSVLGVKEQVQKYLLQLAGVAVDERQPGMELGLDLDMRGL